MSETVTQVNETTQQIVRSRTCGLKDFYIALVQSNTATAYTAGTPVKLARAIKAKIDEKWTSEKIYSDDNTEEVITSYEGTDVELEINALAPQDRVILFGQLYEKGFLRKSSDDRAPEVAVVRMLAAWDGLPITYAGGIGSMEDLREFARISGEKLDYTIGSALDLFGGKIPYAELTEPVK